MKTLITISIKATMFTVFMALSAGSMAQVYQWKDPESGTTRFSNTAPSWFRGANGESRSAPRTQVYYYGALVDDTGRSYEDRVALRAQSPVGRVLPPLIPPSAQQGRRQPAG